MNRNIIICFQNENKIFCVQHMKFQTSNFVLFYINQINHKLQHCCEEFNTGTGKKEKDFQLSRLQD